MSAFSHPIDLSDIAKQVERQMGLPSLRDKLFVFAALIVRPIRPGSRRKPRSPSGNIPFVAVRSFAPRPRRKGVLSERGRWLRGHADSSTVQRQIAQDESIRRHITASGEIEVARQAIARDHYIAEDVFARLLMHSPFVPSDLVMTYSRDSRGSSRAISSAGSTF